MTAPSFATAVRRWVDNGAGVLQANEAVGRRIDWPRVVPFVLLHAGCLGVLWVGTSTTALVVAASLFVLRMFAITAFYHRYFSHRAFHTTRTAQFIFALLASSAVQRGPLWWASHHRHHHLHSDGPGDSHSPHVHGFFWSHIAWFLADENFATRQGLVCDLERYPELRWLDRFDVVAPTCLALVLYGLGSWLEHAAPGLNTNGAQLMVWGFCISTVVLYHATFTINSLAHRFGARRYATRDDSRNNFWLALITLGEGWHNNHHHFPGAARQGFYWWEIDLSYYGLRLLAALGLIWNLRAVPIATREARQMPENLRK